MSSSDREVEWWLLAPEVPLAYRGEPNTNTIMVGLRNPQSTMGRQVFPQPLLSKESFLGERHVLDTVSCFRTVGMEPEWRRGRKRGSSVRSKGEGVGREGPQDNQLCLLHGGPPWLSHYLYIKFALVY